MGVRRDQRVINFCGGIAATLDAFLLHQRRNLTVYDSPGQWATDSRYRSRRTDVTTGSELIIALDQYVAIFHPL